MDMQPALLRTLPDETAFVDHIAQAIATARRNAIPVIYVVHGYRKYAPEINSNNKLFASMREMLEKADPEQMQKIHSKLQPDEQDIIVIKHRVGAFSGTDLEMVLKALEVKHLVLTGFSTGGSVLTTVQEAADKDYQLTILSDGCIDLDEEVHNVLVTKVFPMQADIMTIDSWEV